MTYLSDKECARVDNIQEVPEAAIEGRLEKGVGEERRSAAVDHPPATGGPHPPPHPHCWAPQSPGLPTWEMNTNEASLLSDLRAVFPVGGLSNINSERPLRLSDCSNFSSRCLPFFSLFPRCPEIHSKPSGSSHPPPLSTGAGGQTWSPPSPSLP